MKLSDYLQSPSGPQASPSRQAEARIQVREELYRTVSSQKIAQLVSLGRERARAELSAAIDQIMNGPEYAELSLDQRLQIADELLDMILGLGPIEPLLEDPSVTEVMVCCRGSIFFERDGALHLAQDRFESEEQLRLVVDRIVSPLGRRVDEQQPVVNARLPQGHRVNVIIPPVAIDGTALTIRKFRESAFSLEDMVALGTLTPAMAQLLAWAVRARMNIAVSGGTGGGKTTLLNALSQVIPADERIVTIEDSAELRFDRHPHVVRLEARMANSEGKGEVTIRDLMTNALRMRPDRIVVGECRGAEALDMLQAMNTGHDGSLTTLHAGSPQEVMARLTMMVRYGMDLPVQVIQMQIVSALDLIVQQDRMADGIRRVTQIAVRTEAGGLDDPYRTVVQWDRLTGEYTWHEPPSWLAALDALGVATAEEVAQWEHSVQ